MGEEDCYLSTKVKKSVQPKHYIHIATLNTLTLRTEESLEELIIALQNLKWTIIGLSEVRRLGEKILEHENYIFYHNGETPGKNGVGFLLKKEVKDQIEEIIGISERIAILNLKIGDELWSIVQIYSPTENYSNTEIDLFYSKLNTAIKEHTHKNLILMGDFNAQIGERRNGEEFILGPFSYGKRTRNGNKLIELAFENNLKVLNTEYQQRINKRWTWISPGGHIKNEIDYILTNRNRLFEDCRVIQNMNFNSNHRMVRANLNTNHIKKHRKFKIHPKRIHEVINTKESKTQLHDFLKTTEGDDIQTKYNKLSDILNKPTAKTKTKANNVTSNAKELLEKRAELLRIKDKTKNVRTEISRISKEIKEQMRKDRQAHRLKTFESHITKTGGTKKAIRELSQFKEWIPMLVSKPGRHHTRRPDILNTATEFYRELYSRKCDTEVTDLSNKDQENEIPEVTPREVEKAIETQKKDKSPGPDNISNEFLLVNKDQIVPVLTSLFNDVIKNESIPKQWSTSTISLIHKKGDTNNINNYRPISLMSNIYKVFAKVILRRITAKLDENQPREQAGFRRGYSTLDHIHVIKQIFEKSKEYEIPFYCCFVDYCKAFDTIEHESIWLALKNQGIESKYIRILREIYKNSTAKVKMESKGKEIRIQRGVRQGDPLSPKLFAAVLEEIFKKLDWEVQGIKINGEMLSHLRFADDLVILATTKDELEQMLNDLDTESRKIGLTMNTSKTKALTNSIEEPIVVNNHLIEYVQEYTYLGQIISHKDLTTIEIETRIGNAWKRYWSFKELMKNKETNIYIKRKLFNTCVLPVLTYGCQTWALTKAHLKKLEVCQRSMERSMLAIRKLDKINHTDIRNKTKLNDVTYTIRRNKWRWTGHTIRGTDKWSKSILHWFPKNRTRKRGRPHKRWSDEIKATAGGTWMRVATWRQAWKGLEEAFVKGQTDDQAT